MSEHCHLRLNHVIDAVRLPAACIQSCEAEWLRSIKLGIKVGQYVKYAPAGDTDTSVDSPGCELPTEDGGNFFVAVGKHYRQVIVTDDCIEHGRPAGEQVYGFYCDNPCRQDE